MTLNNPQPNERIEAMIKGFPCSQEHYKGGGLEPITEMCLTASKYELRGYLKLTAYVYIKRAGKKQGESVYKEIGKIATYLCWLDYSYNYFDLSILKVPEVKHINNALDLLGFDTLSKEEESYLMNLAKKYNK